MVARRVLDNSNGAVPVIHAFGLNIAGLHDAAGAPPGITAQLAGAVENINAAKVEELAQSRGDALENR